VGDHKLLVLSVIPDEVIVIAPNGIDQMGVIAQMRHETLDARLFMS
jgi:hypothetical protein